MKFETRKWLKFSLINLFIIASLGVLLRYKIGFNFPFFDQRNIHHSHSHMAFIGWITHTLYVFLVNYLQNKTSDFSLKKFNLIIKANLICVYAMALSFFIQGYGAISIALSTATIILAAFFTYYFLKDTKKISGHKDSLPWFKAGLWFNLFSTLGTFYLAYMMISRNFNEKWYLASEYFYLHFQYNGFFIFCCIGLAIHEVHKLLPQYKYNKNIFILFFASVIPAYFLSTLWAKLPNWLYIMVVLAAFTQFIAWCRFFFNLKKAYSKNLEISKFVKALFLFISLAFTIKLLLQLGSTIPMVSQLAFGFRPIVIAYLHLVLLAVISVFLLSYAYTFDLIYHNKKTIFGLCIFIAGVFLNELVLAIQGIASFGYITIPHANGFLFGISLILWFGALLLMASQLQKKGA